MMHWLATLSQHDFVGNRREASEENDRGKLGDGEATGDSKVEEGLDCKQSVTKPATKQDTDTCTGSVGDEELPDSHNGQ